ncbi:tricarballylate utilization 4Fe-4S protein TcuB [Azospirillum sp. TSO35-2]|uniref:tricarballylate utilization 4Fe-4S protein TcuB n=1 Tax=Azospirillum sp. TSO35-2 TaxID=716796 RepID=UPI000D611195|nr:tricarballylate utilization 4Fe-4S protein TcuB [Azospirillum sp. TSO35-2]PWC33712.1 signal transduction protein [Azospirillum sp. TSO35-2]
MRGDEDGLTALVEEARWALDVCNACQFCDGYCAVFPALKRRQSLALADLALLSNLCHNCRSCYHACQYAPPHAFAVNLPKSLSRLRHQSYRDHAWPKALAGRLRRNGRFVLSVTLLAVVATLLLAVLWLPPEVLLGRHAGPGAFYRVLPWGVIAGAAGLAAGWSLLAVGLGVVAFWRSLGPPPAGAAMLPALREALRDAATLRNLGGGGVGCNDRDERFSQARRRFHHAMAYGFALCFASTMVATAYDHLLGWPAPYPVLSAPVLLGCLGGAGLMVGTAGLALLQRRAHPGPVAPELIGADRALLAQLFLTAASGFCLLAARETPAMGPLLAIHLGIVLGFFITLPCGKFLHAPFRAAALLRAALERQASGNGRSR